MCGIFKWKENRYDEYSFKFLTLKVQVQDEHN